ncbi:hypothetical protein HYQ46_008088 [Verticillium longisporum]|nr:hypothetical protein HYQ46_008088 [Verticillium longisporum]
MARAHKQQRVQAGYVIAAHETRVERTSEIRGDLRGATSSLGSLWISTGPREASTWECRIRDMDFQGPAHPMTPWDSLIFHSAQFHQRLMRSGVMCACQSYPV